MASLRKNCHVRVADGVSIPDLPEISCSGWTGVVTSVSGKKNARKCIIEWDENTIAGMSKEYREICEEKQLYFAMTCLTEEQVEVVD